MPFITISQLKDLQDVVVGYLELCWFGESAWKGASRRVFNVGSNAPFST